MRIKITGAKSKLVWYYDFIGCVFEVTGLKAGVGNNTYYVRYYGSDRGYFVTAGYYTKTTDPVTLQPMVNQKNEIKSLLDRCYGSANREMFS